MAAVLTFFANVLGQVWDLFLNGFPEDYIRYTIILFVTTLVVSRLIVPVIAVNRTPKTRVRKPKKGGDD